MREDVVYVGADVMLQCSDFDTGIRSNLPIDAVENCRVVALDEKVVGGECVYQLFVVVKAYADPDACATELAPLLYTTTISV